MMKKPKPKPRPKPSYRATKDKFDEQRDQFAAVLKLEIDALRQTVTDVESRLRWFEDREKKRVERNGIMDRLLRDNPGVVV